MMEPLQCQDMAYTVCDEVGPISHGSDAEAWLRDATFGSKGLGDQIDVWTTVMRAAGQSFARHQSALFHSYLDDTALHSDPEPPVLQVTVSRLFDSVADLCAVMQEEIP